MVFFFNDHRGMLDNNCGLTSGKKILQLKISKNKCFYEFANEVTND